MRFLFFFIFLGNYSLAHPVIYKGGWVYQGSFLPNMSEINISYSFHRNWSVAFNSHRFDKLNEYNDAAIGLNSLVKRWLQHDSQANLYFGAHLGKYKDKIEEGTVGHAMLMADWEDREYYTLFRTKRFFRGDQESQDYLARFGFAPYVAGMDELQSWLIIQGYYYEETSKQAVVTPMLRFFYKNVLWEIGSTLKGHSFLTLMVHY